MQAYCMKCRAKREMKDAKAITMKNGKPATQGVCPVCGTKMFRIQKKKRNYFFDNILPSEEEYQKLVERFGEAGTKDRLEGLSLYKKSKGKRYKDDYATVLAWERREEMRGGQRGAYRGSSRQLRPRETYTRPEDY